MAFTRYLLEIGTTDSDHINCAFEFKLWQFSLILCTVREHLLFVNIYLKVGIFLERNFSESFREFLDFAESVKMYFRKSTVSVTHGAKLDLKKEPKRNILAAVIVDSNGIWQIKNFHF